MNGSMVTLLPDDKPRRLPWWRRWRKAILWMGGIGLVGLVSGWIFISSAFFFRGIILPRIEKKLRAQITIEHVDWSPLKGVALQGLVVRTTGHKPVFKADELRLRARAWELGSGPKIRQLLLSNPVLHIVVAADGTSNFDSIREGMRGEGGGKASDISGVSITNGTMLYTRQQEPLGLGHAVLMSRNVLNDEPFAVILPDDVIHAEPPVLQQMTEIFEEFGGPVLLVERVPRESVDQYGIIDASIIRDGVFRVNGLVEKPEPSQAPSNLAIIGRYILTSDVFQELEQTREDERGEIQLTDAIRMLCMSGERVVGVKLPRNEKRYDIGNFESYFKTFIEFALADPSHGPSLQKTYKKLLS